MIDIYKSTKEEVDAEILRLKKEIDKLQKYPKCEIAINLMSEYHRLIQDRKFMDTNLYDNMKSYLQSRGK